MENETKLEEELLSPQQVAASGLMGRDLQLKLRGEGKLKYYKVGRRILYSRRHLSDCLASLEQNSQAAQA